MSTVIRNAIKEDYEEILVIYERARSFMKEAGNPDQWGDTWPPLDLIKEDIELKRNFVCEVDGKIQAVFAMIYGEDPTYQVIEGSWLNDLPYAAVHRVASRGEIRGISQFIFDWCLNEAKNIKIDTHSDNIPMQKALLKNGFTKCGKIWIESGDERIAFQKSIKQGD